MMDEAAKLMVDTAMALRTPGRPMQGKIRDLDNLTDEELRYGKDTERNDTLLYGKTGRSYVLGANYKF